MNRKIVWMLAVVLGVAGLAVAQDESVVDVGVGHDTEAVEADVQGSSTTWALIGICLAGATAVIGGGLSIARLGKAAIESIARQPEASGAMFAPMIITAAMIEGAMMLAIIMCFLAVFRV
jgi:F-type H+-transporting ATPase subunit c